MTDIPDMADAELLSAALPWLQELLRRGMLGVMISVPATVTMPPKIAQAFPGPEDYQPMDDHVLLFATYSWDETIDDPETRQPANSSRRLRPV